MIDDKALIDYRHTSPYQQIVTDCQAIAVEKTFNSRMELIEGKHLIGERIVTDSLYKKYSKGNRQFVNDLGADLGKVSETDLYLCIAFYEKYPKLEKFITESGQGKNLSWTKVTNRYLFETKDKHQEEKESCKHDLVTVKKCRKCSIIVK